MSNLERVNTTEATVILGAADTWVVSMVKWRPGHICNGVLRRLILRLLTDASATATVVDVLLFMSDKERTTITSAVVDAVADEDVVWREEAILLTPSDTAGYESAIEDTDGREFASVYSENFFLAIRPVTTATSFKVVYRGWSRSS